MQNDEDDEGVAEPRGQGDPSTSGRLNGAAPVSNGGLMSPIIKLAENELQRTHDCVRTLSCRAEHLWSRN